MMPDMDWQMHLAVLIAGALALAMGVGALMGEGR